MNARVTLFGFERCVGCGLRSGSLCAACAAACLRPPAVALPPGIRSVICPWAYEGAARALVLELKLRGRRSAAAVMAEAMAREIALCGLPARALCWVPGRDRDTRRRGFDHAQLLARRLAYLTGIPALPLLANARERTDQAGLSGAERRRNLAGAFHAAPFAGDVALVDDVMTTGATASACAAALRAAGVPRIDLVCACISGR